MTDQIEDREIFMKGIDYSYYYEQQDWQASKKILKKFHYMAKYKQYGYDIQDCKAIIPEWETEIKETIIL